MLEITKTTSQDARYQNEGNKLDDPNIEKLRAKKTGQNNDEDEGKELVADNDLYIYVSFWRDRPLINKLLWLVYRVLRMVYVSLWFYFVPFIVIIGSYVVPLLGEN